MRDIRTYWLVGIIPFGLLPLTRSQPQKKPVARTSVVEHRDVKELYAPVVAANNQFSVKFFKAAYRESPRENVLTSPASLSYAFALLLNGSQGAGHDQIADLFSLNANRVMFPGTGNPFSSYLPLLTD